MGPGSGSAWGRWGLMMIWTWCWEVLVEVRHLVPFLLSRSMSLEQSCSIGSTRQSCSIRSVTVTANNLSLHSLASDLQNTCSLVFYWKKTVFMIALPPQSSPSTRHMVHCELKVITPAYCCWHVTPLDHMECGMAHHNISCLAPSLYDCTSCVLDQYASNFYHHARHGTLPCSAAADHAFPALQRMGYIVRCWIC